MLLSLFTFFNVLMSLHYSCSSVVSVFVMKNGGKSCKMALISFKNALLGICGADYRIDLT